MGGEQQPGAGGGGRETWTGRFDFFLSSIGLAVGLGNAWRFPYKTYENGGATFLVPYFTFLTLIGIPCYFLENAVGQFAGAGPIHIWRAVPFLKGVGWGMVLLVAMLCVYYNMIIAYNFYYLFASFTSKLPWQQCSDEWIEKYNCNENTTMSPAMVYWKHKVLEQSSGIDDAVGELKWDLSLCLLLSWLVIFFILINGVRSSGKVVYITATLPYILLIILLVRNALLDGAVDGIEFYLKPDWDRLKESKIWYEAAIQIAISFGIGFGAVMTNASYNKFHNNIFRDSMLVIVINVLTSLLAGFVIFTIIGHLSKITGSPVEQVLIGGGPGLAFVAYAEGLTKLPIAPLWSVLFFLTMVMLGVDSQFTSVEVIVTSIMDEFRLAEKWRYARTVVTAISCVLMFGAGLIQCSKAGIYIVHLLDTYVPSYALLGLLLLQVIGLAWFYGVRRLSRDITLMVGESSIYGYCQYFLWMPMWAFFTPAALVFIVVFAGINWEPITYLAVDSEYDYPDWADILGWVCVGLPLALVVLGAMVAVFNWCCYPRQALCGPREDYGRTLDDIHYQSRHKHKGGSGKEQLLFKAYDKDGRVVSSGDIGANQCAVRRGASSIDRQPTYMYSVLDGVQRQSDSGLQVDVVNTGPKKFCSHTGRCSCHVSTSLSDSTPGYGYAKSLPTSSRANSGVSSDYGSAGIQLPYSGSSSDYNCNLPVVGSNNHITSTSNVYGTTLPFSGSSNGVINGGYHNDMQFSGSSNGFTNGGYHNDMQFSSSGQTNTMQCSGSSAGYVGQGGFMGSGNVQGKTGQVTTVTIRT